MAELRHLVLVLGDQLDLDAAAFDDFDASRDAVWMAEVAEESTHVWSSKPRIALSLGAFISQPSLEAYIKAVNHAVTDAVKHPVTDAVMMR